MEWACLLSSEWRRYDVWSGRVYLRMTQVRWCGEGVSTFFRITGKMVWSGLVYLKMTQVRCVE